MFDRGDLRAAVEAGVIGQEQSARLEAFLAARNDPDRMLDAENLRFLTNLNDIFLSIGVAILLVGVATASGLILGRTLDELHLMALLPLPTLAAAWGLAEYLAGRRRLLLPSMVLCVAICLCAAVTAAAIIVPSHEDGRWNDWETALASVGYAGLGASAVAALAVHLRFRLSFALFPLALSIAGLVYAAVAQVDHGGRLIVGGIATLAVGLLTLAAAIGFDARDPQRVTINADRAFWLHMAAAPQIILGVRGLVIGSGFAPAGVADATVMLGLLIVFGLISLGLNRRALIVSSMLTFGTSVGVLINKIAGGGGGAVTLMLTALVVGGAIVLLGAGWRTARRWLLALVPRTGAVARIFPAEPA